MLAKFEHNAIVAKESNSILPQIEKRVPLILIGDRKNGAMPVIEHFHLPHRD